MNGEGREDGEIARIAMIAKIAEIGKSKPTTGGTETRRTLIRKDGQGREIGKSKILALINNR
jgi:hypothetical protein